MAGRTIEISPEELVSQAQRLEALSNEFTDLENGILKAFKDVNSHWSENLSKSFSVRVSDFKNDFNALNESLLTGAKVAAESAVSFVNVDQALAKYMVGGDKSVVSQAVGSVANMVNPQDESEELRLRKIIKSAVMGSAKAVCSGVQYVKSYWVDKYNEHGALFKTIEYGKAALKITEAGITMLGACFAPLSGVGTIAFAEAMNDVHSAASDIGYIYTEQYDRIGTDNYLKDLLIEKGHDFGEMIGNETLGETYGKTLYTGLDFISLYDGAKKALNSLGILSGRVYGGAPNPEIFGKVEYADILDDKPLGYKDFLKGAKGLTNEVIERVISEDSSVGRAVINTVESCVSILKKANKLGGQVRDIVFGG